MTASRLFRTVLLTAALLGFALPASAKEYHGVKHDIQKTGIKSIDEVLAEAAKLDNRLDKAEAGRKDAKVNIATSMSLAKTATLGDMATELKTRAGGKVKMATDSGGKPKLEATEAVPTDVQTAIDAVNAALDGYMTAITEVAGLPKDAASLVKKSKKLPKKFKNELKNTNLSELPDVVKDLKAIKQDAKIIAELPGRSTEMSKLLVKDVKTMTKAFGLDWKPGAGK
jgi:hypothetical protein